jgi:hypothetical protein
MSYMNQGAFASAGGIQELNFDEIEMTNGGLPIIVPVVIALYGTEIAYGAGFVAGAAVAIYAYANG